MINEVRKYEEKLEKLVQEKEQLLEKCNSQGIGYVTKDEVKTQLILLELDNKNLKDELNKSSTFLLNENYLRRDIKMHSLN